jgi:hypothetical protein
MFHAMLLCVYDFDRCPVSYDLMAAILNAQYQAKGLPVHVLFVPGLNGGWRTGDHKPISDAEREWRLTHIIYPMCRIAGVTWTHAPSREYAGHVLKSYKWTKVLPEVWTPETPCYDYGLDRTMRAFNEGFKPPWKVGDRARQHARAWLENIPGTGPFVSVTLRETHTATRNSTQGAWQQAVAIMAAAGLRPIVVRDTEKMTRGLDWPHFQCPLASCDLEFRAAIYEQCAVNLSRNGGPSMLPCYLGFPYLIFGVLAEPYVDPLTGRPHFVPTAKYMANKGLPPGAQIHKDDPSRRFVWADDSDPVLIVSETFAALPGDVLDAIKNTLPVEARAFPQAADNPGPHSHPDQADK